MRWKVLGCLLVVVTLLGFSAVPAAAAGPAGLSARLDTLKSSIGRGERPVVELTLTNDSGADVYLLRWQTPFAGVRANLFDVQRDGEPVQYLGALIKFHHPRAQDYIRLAAGASRSVRVDLGRYYDFSRTGEYSVKFRVGLQDALRDAAPAAIGELAELASEARFLAVERDDRAARLFQQPSLQDKAASNSYVGCSTSRQSSLATARSNGTTMASGAISYLGSHTSSSPGGRYSAWFGAATSSRYSSVQSHYNNIRSTFQNAAMTFDCTCTDPYYAYVYPTQPYRIYLCNAFWSAPSTGTDSKAGTLVHETSHFNVVAGTDDWAYGQSACRTLATKKPDRAVDNADSHEYFAENTPNIN